jgi:hypothetical protein
VTIAGYQKFVVAIVGLVAIVANEAGVDIISEVSNELIAALTAAGVFFFPNK